MTTIGYFRRDGETFVGRLSTLQIDATVKLVPIERVSPRAPAFRAYVGDNECGAAWRPLDPASGAILNLELDDPTWSEPVNARLMAGEEPHPLVWIRQKADRAPERAGDKPADDTRPRPPT
ncbi:uncharacterized protein (DUF736 family) [Caulobacter rhizosphaerae]|uniref:Uncharacterized protein (DUF736 family) n=1 Tax=Caulobacter rhizosphaerae TaxID=2010972 RepID=A0ABU1MVV9_9CAUL|nr:DUF736 domain-containing protein [Caulobacter rhizosphaerae]MDR6530286.1 uncharacterized protein (DUF736 family) [Caulobacter rhizosphaerae]